MTPEQLTEIPGIGEKMVEKIQLAVAGYFQSLENQQAGARRPKLLSKRRADEEAPAEETEAAAEEPMSAAETKPTEGENAAEAAEASADAETGREDGRRRGEIVKVARDD